MRCGGATEPSLTLLTLDFLTNLALTLAHYCSISAQCWVPLQDLPSLIAGGPGSGAYKPASQIAAGPPLGRMIPAGSLSGIYGATNDCGQGIGRGHVFALLELAAQAAAKSRSRE